MKIAIYGRPTNIELAICLKELIEKAYELEFELVVWEPLWDFLKSSVTGLTKIPETFISNAELPGQIDYLISLGGDGTILDTVTLVEDSEIPVLGVNVGRLGFLADTQVEQLSRALEALHSGHFVLEKRSLLKLESDNGLFGKHNYALNELTLHKRDTSNMMIVHAFLNGEFLNSYWADGLIMATPTGSTGYSLSCGGPIIVPQSESFLLAPIAPHNLNVRPILVPDNSVVSFEIEGRSPFYLASLDSRSISIDSKIQLAARKEDFKFNMVKLHGQNFLDTLRRKLMWGSDIRN